MFLSILYVNEEEGFLGVEKLLVGIGSVTAFDGAFVEKSVWYTHERFVHAILGVKELERIASLNQSREH